ATGLLATTDTKLAYAAADPNALATPAISTIAYTNLASGATKLYGIDRTLNTLVTEAAPANGVISTIGALNVTVGGGQFAALDFRPNEPAFAMLNTDLYRVNLATGAATQVGNFAIGGATRAASPSFPPRRKRCCNCPLRISTSSKPSPLKSPSRAAAKRR